MALIKEGVTAQDLMTKNWEGGGKPEVGLTTKQRCAYSPRSLTHAWVCPGFPEKDEEVGSVQADPVKGKLNMWAGVDSQDLDMEESC